MNSFYNPYMMSGNYVTELQNMRDRIDNQIQQVQQQQQNMPQVPQVTQNFQLSPNINNNIKYVNDFTEVEKEIVVNDTYFFNNSMTNMWIKNPKGDIRTFSLKEIKPKDDKDILIEKLQKQIAELKEDKLNEYDKSDDEQLFGESSSELNEQFGEPITTSKSSDVSSISNSKTTKRKSGGHS